MKTFLANSLAAVLLTLLVSACSDGSSDEADMTSGTRAVLVSTAIAEIRNLPIWLETAGQVHSKSAPTLAAEVSGRITKVMADTGDRIVEGQLLAKTDTSTLLLQQQAAQAGIERLEVHIANGERRVERFRTLSSKNLSSQTQLDDAREQLEVYRADYKAAEAQLAIVNDSLTKSLVVAPVSGVIQQRMIATGDFVDRGQPLFEITQPELLQAWLPYPESVALKVHVGQVAEIFSPLTPGESVTGEITDLQPSVGLGSRAIMAIIDLENPGKLRPSATLTGKVLVETRQAAVMVPIMSIVRRPAGDIVYVINGDKAEARIVNTGYHNGAMVEITSGLAGNEVVATDGAPFLTDGASVSQ
ncbi:MAG: efflux RND transporter periplasmic adaptor subunit [Gammaproteobacteria bacterium]|nr:efflux RND transporter periplasmic adaptor subunit [Gammaproteobacteria bacterium]